MLFCSWNDLIICSTLTINNNIISDIILCLPVRNTVELQSLVVLVIKDETSHISEGLHSPGEVVLIFICFVLSHLLTLRYNCGDLTGLELYLIIWPHNIIRIFFSNLEIIICKKKKIEIYYRASHDIVVTVGEEGIVSIFIIIIIFILIKILELKF